MATSQDWIKGARNLTRDEYEQAYHRLTAVAIRYGVQLDPGVAHNALTEALAAIGVLAPAPEPEPEGRCTAGLTVNAVVWLLSRDEGARHGGFILGRLPNGTIPTYTSGDSRYERQFTDSPTAHGGAWSGPEPGTPTEQPLALVPGCACGWRGPDLHYDPSAGRCGNDTCHDGQAVAAHRLWKEHAEVAQPAAP
ncbi:hypothetical protein ACWEQ8_35145 [Streptomyces noursei]